MPIRRFRDRRPRLLAPSQILRPPVRQSGGGRWREDLVREARGTIGRGSRSFAFASRLLDRPTRERAWLLYAWCRRGDDIVAGDRPEGAEDAENLIQAIRVLTRRALDGQPTADPAFDGFGQVAQEAGLGLQLADDVIEGFALDAAGWQPHSEADLIRYCYHAGGAVAVMMARIIGVPEDDEERLDRAFELGVAFELIAIARDLCDDDAAERCHLPLDWLAEADIPPGEHLKPTFRGPLVALAGRLLDLAEAYAASALRGTEGLGFRQRWAVLTAANIYLAIGRKVRERGAHAWDHRVATSAFDKLGAMFRGFMEALDAPLPAATPRYTRGAVLLAVRMEGPVAPIPMTPLRDEDVRVEAPGDGEGL
ncbi:MAG TPA: phytoene/squalene synthase family protein [Croceibacterium sp.]|nr:phytoene/squalene synthase family protein [Croceibacterium sp.]